MVEEKKPQQKKTPCSITIKLHMNLCVYIYILIYIHIILAIFHMSFKIRPQKLHKSVAEDEEFSLPIREAEPFSHLPVQQMRRQHPS